VIEQNMHMKLPEGAVTSEFVLQHGMIDAIVHRRDLRSTLARLLRLYTPVYTSTVTVHTEPLIPAALKVELNSADRRGESDGLRPGI
jgi:hypothetical protein